MMVSMAEAEPWRLVTADSAPQEDADGGSVLLLVQNPPLLRSVRRVLSATHVSLTTRTELPATPQIICEQAFDLIVCDYGLLQALPDAGAKFFDSLAAHPQGPAIIILSEQLEAHGLSELLTRSTAHNLVAKMGELDSNDLLITARKLIERDIFGIEKYLHWGSVIHGYRLSCSNNRQHVLSKLEEFLAGLQCRSRIQGRLLTVADEFLMNAFFDAPTGADGTSLYSQRPRNEPIALAAQHAPTLSFGSDGRRVAISCRDPFGSLRPERFRHTLARCLRRGSDQVNQASGGAGIGLYMAFQYLQHLIVNIAPNCATEVIGITDLTTPAAAMSTAPRSVNVFTIS